MRHRRGTFGGIVLAALVLMSACSAAGDEATPSSTTEAERTTTSSTARPTATWADVEDVLEAHSGRVEVEQHISAGTETLTMHQDWRYDGTTFEIRVTSSEFDGELRYVVEDGEMFMRHPQAEARCGSSWVSMDLDSMDEVAALDVDLESIAPPSQTLLLALVETPGPPSSTDPLPRWEVAVSGFGALNARADGTFTDEQLDSIEAIDLPTIVTIDDDSVTIVVDELPFYRFVADMEGVSTDLAEVTKTMVHTPFDGTVAEGLPVGPPDATTCFEN